MENRAVIAPGAISDHRTGVDGAQVCLIRGNDVEAAGRGDAISQQLHVLVISPFEINASPTEQ